MAEGVLPVCLGQGTRVVEYLQDSGKTYLAGITLGVSTDTLDAEGRITKEADASGITIAQIETALNLFRGTIAQIPPSYSALKHQGKPLYQWAREGVTIEGKSRQVTVYELDITGWYPPVLNVKVVCSKGTYIRSLANDLGERLGCGGSLKSLVRTAYGPFDIKNSHTPDEIKKAFAEGRGPDLLLPIDTVLQNIPAAVLDEPDARKMLCGNNILSSNCKPQTANYGICRAYSVGGCFLALLKYIPEEDIWKPEKVFL